MSPSQSSHHIQPQASRLQRALFAYKVCKHLEYQHPDPISPGINSSETVIWQAGVCSTCFEILKQETEAMYEQWINGPHISGQWAPQSAAQIPPDSPATTEGASHKPEEHPPPVGQFAADLRADMQTLGYDPIPDELLQDPAWWGYDFWKAAGASSNKTEQKDEIGESDTVSKSDATAEPSNSINSDLVAYLQESEDETSSVGHRRTSRAHLGEMAIQQHSMVLRPRNEDGKAQTRKK